jgi:hypothetical protein
MFRGKLFAAVAQPCFSTVCRTILVEKTDRPYPNIKDYATVDEPTRSKVNENRNDVMLFCRLTKNSYSAISGNS